MSEKDPGSGNQGYGFKVAQDAKYIYGQYKNMHSGEKLANARVDEAIRVLDSPFHSEDTIAQVVKDGSDAVEQADSYVQAQANIVGAGRKEFEANEGQYRINAKQEARIAGVEIDTEHSASERAEMARQAVSDSLEHAGQRQ